MKKVITVLLTMVMLFAMCGCANVVEEYPIDARYTESHQEIVTDYDYQFDLFAEESVKLMPNTHTKVFPEKYEIQYRINYDDGSTKTEWREVARDEYEKAVEKYGLEKEITNE